MAFTLVHRDGRRSEDAALDDVLRLLAEVAGPAAAAPGSAHTDAVAVEHAAGWRLTVRADGVVVFGNALDERVPDRHTRDLPPAALVELAEAVAVGSFYETLDHEWRDGAPPPVSSA